MRKNASRTAVIRRHLRLRQKITGTADRPRLECFPFFGEHLCTGD